MKPRVLKLTQAAWRKAERDLKTRRAKAQQIVTLMEKQNDALVAVAKNLLEGFSDRCTKFPKKFDAKKYKRIARHRDQVQRNVAAGVRTWATATLQLNKFRRS